MGWTPDRIRKAAAALDSIDAARNVEAQIGNATNIVLEVYGGKAIGSPKIRLPAEIAIKALREHIAALEVGARQLDIDFKEP